jgi:arylsulfatase A
MKLPHAPVLPTPDTRRTPEIEKLVEEARDLAVEDHGYSLKGGSQWQRDVVAYIDKMVGRVIDKLEQEGLRENTLIVFTSDNGPGTDGAVREGVVRLPGMKGGVLEGATREPCLISWPAAVKAGSTYDGLIDFTDFLPTFADLAGESLPDDSPQNGISFAQVLLGAEDGPRKWVYIHDGWHPNPASRELYDGHSWGGNPKAPPGQKIEPRVDPPYPHIKAFRYVIGPRFKLYSDGRFYDLGNDLHERNPIRSVEGFPEAKEALKDLREVLDRFPEKEDEAVRIDIESEDAGGR